MESLTTTDIGVVFQPIVDVASGTTFAQEALVRCRRPEYPSPPVLFEHAVAENACGLLGRLIREVAFDTCGEIPLFVNIHPEELNSSWLVRPDDPLGFHAHPVFLEVTEAAAFTHFDLCLGVLKELCLRTDARLVVDDFGAGHSNLQRVVDLEPAVVKLDLALTRDVHRYPRKQSVVRNMVNLCRELGASIVAEGVEQLDELKCIRDLGVTYAQGYLLARPAAPAPEPVWPFGAPASRPRSSGRLPAAAAPAPLPVAVGESQRPTQPTPFVVTLPAAARRPSLPPAAKAVVRPGVGKNSAVRVTSAGAAPRLSQRPTTRPR